MQSRWERTQEDSLASYGAHLERFHNAFAGEVVMRAQDLATALDVFTMRFSMLQTDLESQKHAVESVNQGLDNIKKVSTWL